MGKKQGIFPLIFLDWDDPEWKKKSHLKIGNTFISEIDETCVSFINLLCVNRNVFSLINSNEKNSWHKLFTHWMQKNKRSKKYRRKRSFLLRPMEKLLDFRCTIQQCASIFSASIESVFFLACVFHTNRNYGLNEIEFRFL